MTSFSSKEKQIKNISLYIVPVVLGNLLPLLTLPIFTRILTPEDYGVWGLAQVYALFVNGIANFGLTIGYERNFFEYKEEKKVAGLLFTTLLFVTISFIFFGFITYFFKNQFSQWIIGSPDHSNILFWSYCATGIMGLKSYFLIYFKNTENAKTFTKYAISDSILVVLISLFLVAYLRIGIIGLVWGQLMASFIIFSILTVTFARSIPINFNFKALKDSLKISLPLTPRIFFGIIGKQFNKYLIGLLNTVGGVGIFNIGQKIAHIVFSYMTAIENVFLPQVYKRMFEQGEEGKTSIGHYLTPFLYLSILLGIIISLFSEEIIIILTPRSYYGAIDVVTILSMLYGTYFFGKIPQLIYAKKTHITSMLTLVSIGLNIAINIPFIYQWGVMGAAWGTLLAGILTITIYFIVSQHYYKIEWEYRKIVAIFLIFFTASITIILLRYFDTFYWIRLIVKLGSILTYFYLGMRFNIINNKNYRLVKDMIFSIKFVNK